jgi:hypothetical protein
MITNDTFGNYQMSIYQKKLGFVFCVNEKAIA